MLQPRHDLISAPSRMTPERMIGFGFVVLFHLVLIYALVMGLKQAGIIKFVPPTTIAFIDEPLHPPQPLPPTPTHWAKPDTPTANPPPLPTGDTGDNTIHVELRATAGGDTSTGVSPVAGTHSTPPYPALAKRMGEEGRVVLVLTISPQGNVVSAQLSRSSGFPELDQAAISWVVSHWKYKPAMQNGVAVAATANAAAVFSLKEH